MVHRGLPCERGAGPMRDSGLVLKEALVVVKRALKERGFSARRTTFYRRTEGGNTVVLSVQRGVKSSAAETEVALNYGVYSARIGERLQEDPSCALDVWRAHWRRRLTERGREKWLKIKATGSPEESAKAILSALEAVLPELVEHSTDEALCNEWLAGSSPGLVEMKRLLYLTILVNEIGPAEKLGGLLGELRRSVSGGVHEKLIESQLAMAGVRVQR